jgi:hypothetical protein
MDIARNWRLKKQRYTLDKQSHLEGLVAVMTPSLNGHNGNGHKEVQAPIQPNAQVAVGEVYAFTKIYDAPAGFEEFAPYTIALVKLDDGRMITAQLTDLGAEPAQIGMPVEMVTRVLRSATDERGMLVYGYKFRPVLAG